MKHPNLVCSKGHMIFEHGLIRGCNIMPQKYQAMTISNKRKSGYLTLTFNDTSITISCTINITGTTTDKKKCNSTSHVNTLIKQGGLIP